MAEGNECVFRVGFCFYSKADYLITSIKSFSWLFGELLETIIITRRCVYVYSKVVVVVVDDDDDDAFAFVCDKFQQSKQDGSSTKKNRKRDRELKTSD